MRGCRRFFRSTLQPIAEHLEYNPVAVAARYRGNYLGSVSLPTQQAASYSAAPVDKPKREGATPDELPGQALDPNREPPEGSLEKQGGGTPSKVWTWHQHWGPCFGLWLLQPGVEWLRLYVYVCPSLFIVLGGAFTGQFSLCR